MLFAFAHRIRSQAGQAQLTLTGIIAVAAVMIAAIATNSVAAVASVRPNPQAEARGLLQYAGYTANEIAAAHHGSYDHVGLLDLHKVGLVPFAPSNAHPWVSAAVSTAHTFRITVQAEPSGGSYTLTRSDGSTRVSHS